VLHRKTSDTFSRSLASDRAPYQGDQVVGGVGRGSGLIWVRGKRTETKCPVCFDTGPHQLQLSVPSLIIVSQEITFARCRRCDCRFVIDYKVPAYDEAHASDAPLRFYVEQGAGIEFLARAVFVAAQKPSVRSYLDIGCGFGFGPDMATRIFGWNALGLDPGPLASAGREMLGVRIESDYLNMQRHPGDTPYDAIAAMEVIEHMTDPHDFLRSVRSKLSDTGILILSTPNGHYLDSCPDGHMLMPLLSPGYHAVLHTAAGLARLVRKAGLPNVNVVTTPATLFVVASPSNGPLHAEIEMDRDSYVRYLRSRFHDSPICSPIHIGFGYRLLRSLTEVQTYSEALDVFGELREATLIRLGIDIGRPLDVASKVLEEDVAFGDVPTKFPFCLAGLLLCRGTIALNHERRENLATAYFLASRLSSQMLLSSLNGIGISDGELATLPALAGSAMKRLF
jgi:SAM-dependent methyltransferase